MLACACSETVPAYELMLVTDVWNVTLVPLSMVALIGLEVEKEVVIMEAMNVDQQFIVPPFGGIHCPAFAS